MITELFNVVLYQPLLNVLVLLYQYIPGHDFGIAVIVMTIIVRVFLLPLALRSTRTQKALAELQPKIQEIQEKYKTEKEKQMKETTKLYKEAKVNPASGCLPLLIQLPILIALYRVFWQGVGENNIGLLYSFVPHVEIIAPTFLGMVDLSQPSLVLAILAGLFQFIHSKMSVSLLKAKKPKKGKPDIGGIMQKQMVYFLPFFTVFILLKLPSAMGLYWMTATLFSIVQEYVILRQKHALPGKAN